MELAPVEVVSSAWVRGPARVEDGEVVLDETRAEEYGFTAPEQSEQMAWDLARLGVRDADERDVLSFVRRYGLLFHGAEDLEDPEVQECRESLQDWWAEAARLRAVGVLYQRIQDARYDGAVRPIQDLLRNAGVGFPSLDSTDEDFVDEYILRAGKQLARMINEGLGGGPNRRHGKESVPPGHEDRRCWWGLKATAPGEFRLTQYPPDLLTRAYSALAHLIATGAEIRFCEACNKQFRPKTARSKCCSSTCSNTARSRKLRDRQRA